MNKSYFGVAWFIIYTGALKPCHDNTRIATYLSSFTIKNLHFKVFSILVLEIYAVRTCFNVVVLPGKDCR